MNPADVRTVQEVELMTPNERAQLVSDSFITDLSLVDPAFLARAREKGRALMEARGYSDNNQA